MVSGKYYDCFIDLSAITDTDVFLDKKDVSCG